MNQPEVTCLCCGTLYPVDGDCPNLETAPHSLELARSVAAELLEYGATTPSVRQVRRALEQIGAV